MNGAPGQNKQYAIRFNMDDEDDRELYQRILTGKASDSSMTAHIKRLIMAGLDETESSGNWSSLEKDLVRTVREEMERQTDRIIGAMLSGMKIASAVSDIPLVEHGTEEQELPEMTDELPPNFSEVLDFIS